MRHYDLAVACQTAASEGGISNADVIKGDAVDAHVVHTFERCIVVFDARRSIGGLDKLLSDWRSNTSEVFRLHWSPLKTAVNEDVGNRRVTLTGFGLGGAIAQLAAADLCDVSEIVTFGSPRVGNAAWCKEQQRYRQSRYVYVMDPMPWVPSRRLGFRHAIKPRWFDGKCWSSPPWHYYATMAWNMAMCSGGSKQMAEMLSHHAIAKYVDALTPEVRIAKLWDGTPLVDR